MGFFFLAVWMKPGLPLGPPGEAALVTLCFVALRLGVINEASLAQPYNPGRVDVNLVRLHFAHGGYAYSP